MKYCKSYHNLLLGRDNLKCIVSCRNCQLKFIADDILPTEFIVLNNKSTVNNIIYNKYYCIRLFYKMDYNIINSHSFEETKNYSIAHTYECTLYKCQNGCGVMKFYDYSINNWIYLIPSSITSWEHLHKDIDKYICNNILINNILL